MSTARATTPEPFTAIADHPAVVAAVAALEPLHQQRRALQKERHEAFRVGGYRTEYTGDADRLVDVTEEAIALARIRLPEFDRELRLLRTKEAPAERALAKAQAQAREELSAAILARQRVEVAKLDRALSEAARVNAELASLDEWAVAQLGHAAATFAWHELMPETATAPSRLSDWRRWAIEYGMLE